MHILHLSFHNVYTLKCCVFHKGRRYYIRSKLHYRNICMVCTVLNLMVIAMAGIPFCNKHNTLYCMIVALSVTPCVRIKYISHLCQLRCISDDLHVSDFKSVVPTKLIILVAQVARLLGLSCIVMH